MLGFYTKLSRRHEMPYAASFCPLYSIKATAELLTEEQVRKRLSCIVTYSVVVGSLRECLVSPPSSSSLRGNSSVVVSEEIYGTGCCCCLRVKLLLPLLLLLLRSSSLKDEIDSWGSRNPVSR